MLPKSLVMAAMAVSLGVSGCASLNAEDREAMLAAAQFTRKQADTPAKLGRLNALPQRTLAFQKRKGANYYIYADATGCSCMYVGDEAAYQRYQQMRLQKNIADEQMAAAEIQQENALDWNAWGPWGPGYF